MSVAPLQQKGRAIVLRFVSILCVACVSGGVRSEPASRDDFWRALAELRPEDAKVTARSRSQREFAVGLGHLMAGRLQDAEASFASLRANADDSVLRIGARMVYSATLQYQEKWDTLAALASDGSAPRFGSQPDLAGVGPWAAAFRAVPAKSLEFQSSGVTTVPLRVSEAGTPLVPVRIANKVYYFWLDTGSSMTIVSSDVANELGLQPLSSDTLQIVTSIGRVAALPALLSRLDIGPVTVRNATAMIVSDEGMRIPGSARSDLPKPIRIDGIVGFDIIRRLDLEVDYVDETLRVRNPAERRLVPRMERNFFLWIGIPVVRMRSGSGVSIHFGLDTGGQQTFATETLLKKLGRTIPRTEKRRIGGMGGAVSLSLPIIPELELWVGHRSLTFREMAVYEPIYQTLVALDGVLGSEIWSSGRIRLDATNGLFEVMDRSSN
jgi:hypothetical protein